MRGRIKHITRAAVLLFYSLYAVSPIYMSSVIGSEGKDFERERPAERLTIGIVWLNVLVSSFFEGARDDNNDGQAQVFNSSRDHALFLIKKKRAVVRERYVVKPLLRTDVLSIGTIETIDHLSVFSREYEISRDPRHQETDGYISLNTGLSPPVLLS